MDTKEQLKLKKQLAIAKDRQIACQYALDYVTDPMEKQHASQALEEAETDLAVVQSQMESLISSMSNTHILLKKQIIVNKKESILAAIVSKGLRPNGLFLFRTSGYDNNCGLVSTIDPKYLGFNHDKTKPVELLSHSIGTECRFKIMQGVIGELLNNEEVRPFVTDAAIKFHNREYNYKNLTSQNLMNSKYTPELRDIITNDAFTKYDAYIEYIHVREGGLMDMSYILRYLPKKYRRPINKFVLIAVDKDAFTDSPVIRVTAFNYQDEGLSLEEREQPIGVYNFIDGEFVIMYQNDNDPSLVLSLPALISKYKKDGWNFSTYVNKNHFELILDVNKRII